MAIDLYILNHCFFSLKRNPVAIPRHSLSNRSTMEHRWGRAAVLLTQVAASRKAAAASYCWVGTRTILHRTMTLHRRSIQRLCLTKMRPSNQVASLKIVDGALYNNWWQKVIWNQTSVSHSFRWTTKIKNSTLVHSSSSADCWWEERLLSCIQFLTKTNRPFGIFSLFIIICHNS